MATEDVDLSRSRGGGCKECEYASDVIGVSHENKNVIRSGSRWREFLSPVDLGPVRVECRCKAVTEE